MPYVRPLLARGWDISFICPPGENVPAAHALGMRTYPLAMRRDFHPPTDVIGSAQLVRCFRRDRPHIVHTHAFKTGHAARVLAAAAGVPIVIHTVHGQPYSLETPALVRAALVAIERLVSLGVDAILVQSDEDRRTLVETGAIRPELITWIGNGIDLARFVSGPQAEIDRRSARAELGLNDEEILFLSAGRLVREKGFVELFDAAIRARREDRRVRLAVAGDIDEGKSDALDPRVVASARDAGVLVLGRRADMHRLYAASDVVALASWREGLPRVLMEGAAMGKPLLAADARGCREVVRPPRNGLLVPVRDPAALARAMLVLAADPALRRSLGEANAVEARERYDIDTVVARVIAVYDRLLAVKGLV